MTVHRIKTWRQLQFALRQVDSQCFFSFANSKQNLMTSEGKQAESIESLVIQLK